MTPPKQDSSSVRRCANPGCRARLASDNDQPLCSLCQRKRMSEPNPLTDQRGDEEIEVSPSNSPSCPDEVMEIVGYARKHLQTLGLIGMEFAFFHRFFNRTLQLELEHIRRDLYGCDGPPLPMDFSFPGPTIDLSDSEEVVVKAASSYFLRLLQAQGVEDSDEVRELVRLETEKMLANLKLKPSLRRRLETASKRSLLWHHLMGLDPSFDDLKEFSKLVTEAYSADSSGDLPMHLWAGTPRLREILKKPMAKQRSPDQISLLLRAINRLGELGRGLPADPESLALSVVRGTPPFPPQGEISHVFTPHDDIQLKIRIYSAKLKPDFSVVLPFPGGKPSEEVPFEFLWSDTFPPCLQTTIVLRNGVGPRPSRVNQEFKRARRGKKFYDSYTKVKDYEAELDVWGMTTLNLVCGMGNRDILRYWAKQEDRPEPDIDGVTTNEEKVLSQQIQRIRQRIAEITAAQTPV
jgi:hypothetical protein